MDVYLETLRRIVGELGPQRSFLSSLGAVLRILAQRHGFVRPHLVIFDPQARMLRLCLADTPPTGREVVYEPGVGITGQVFTQGRPVLVERISDDPVFQNKFFSRTAEEMHSLAFVSVPVLGHSLEPGEGQVVIGVLSADTPVAKRAVLEAQCRFLEVVAGLIANEAAHAQIEPALPAPDSAQAALALPEDVVAASKTMRQTLTRAMQAGSGRAPVLLYGEAGTGKELLAGVIHKAGPRRDMPLVHARCAALGAQVEEALFGVQKGATPHVVQTRKGLFEQAHLGTLCLHGVESLPKSVIPRLLRAVLEQEVMRDGGHGAPVHVDVRLVCTSQRAPEALDEVLGEEFGRLFGARIGLAPLRERPEDIVPLAEHWLRRIDTAQARGDSDAQDIRGIRGISLAAAELLTRHPWPGNVQELQSCMERAAALCQGDVILAWHLPASLQGRDDAQGLPFADAVAHFERELLVDALHRAHGNMLEASRLLGATYRTVHYKIQKYGIDPRKYALRGLA